jgi:MerR family transcriptional regulator, light-induced transcriptional regulator
LYTESEVERLALLGTLTRQGLSIGQIARLSTDQLRSMAANSKAEGILDPQPQVVVGDEQEAIANLVKACLHAARKFDVVMLERTLDKGMVQFGASGTLERLLVALLQELGSEWDAGRFTSAQEHFASSAIRDYLARNMRPMAIAESAPRLLVGTPSGQLHELGAVIAACIARKAGWNVTYLGPSLPAEEIAGACIANNVRALALSIIYPPDDPNINAQLTRLRDLTPAHVSIIVGGQLAFYRSTLQEIRAIEVREIRDFSKLLQQLRSEIAPQQEVEPTIVDSRMGALRR